MIGRALLISAVLALAIIAWAVPPSATAPSRVTALPAVEHPQPTAAPSLRPSASATPSTSVSPSSAVPHPSGTACPTPQNPPNWQGPNFFSDALVTIQVPGIPSLSGSQFGIVPCTNTIPTYTIGFWLNVSTNVRLEQAILTIWGTNWPTALNTQPPIPGYDPTKITTEGYHYMVVKGPTDKTASFFFNVYRDFWPGSSVSFNLTLVSNDPNASPSVIHSAAGVYTEPESYGAGVIDNATWVFNVQSAWYSTNFSQDVDVSTTPSVLSGRPFDPNHNQSVEMTIRSLAAGALSSAPIPRAYANITINGTGANGGFFATGRILFGANNHSTMQLVSPIGPYPGGWEATVQVVAYLPWRGGVVDQIESPFFHWFWTTKGGWWYPNAGLVANLNLTVNPALPSGTVLPTATPVNVSIHSPTQNVTIGSAAVQFRYVDGAGSVVGSLPMAKVNANTSYCLLRGLPPGGKLTFYVSAKDIFGTTTSSGNYSFSETGPAAVSLPVGDGFFFFEAVDLSTGLLVPQLNYTLSNDTWSQSRLAFPFGFGAPLPLAGTSYLPVAFGAYTLTIHAFNETQSATFDVSSPNPPVIIFYVASGPVNPTDTAPIGGVILTSVAGIGAAAAAAYPISAWLKERQRKIEAEQRRITL